MSDLEFDDKNEFHIKSRKLFGKPVTPKIIKLLLKSGIVKTEKQAFYILIGAIVLVVGITWWVVDGSDDGIDYVEGPDGVKHSAEEYFDLVDSGNDPLSPDKLRQ